MQKPRIGLHFIGHGNEEGLFVSGDGQTKERVSAGRLKDMLKLAYSIYFCILNACSTEEIGCQILGESVKHVMCWKGKVHDDVAKKFSQEFHTVLNETPGNYRRAFEQGKVFANNLQTAR